MIQGLNIKSNDIFVKKTALSVGSIESYAYLLVEYTLMMRL